jgi:hypothetical protein
MVTAVRGGDGAQICVEAIGDRDDPAGSHGYAHRPTAWPITGCSMRLPPPA